MSLTTPAAVAPAPGGLSMSLAEGVFTVAWEAVAGADRYEAQYRMEGSGEDWAAVGTTTATVLTYSPRGRADMQLDVRVQGTGAR